MLTSFLKKSKPINFVLVGLFMSFFFLTANLFYAEGSFSLSFIIAKIGLLLVYLFLMVLINFIVKRNDVTKKNTFTIFLFAVFTVIFSPILKTEEIIIASLFILLALRRVVSLRSGLQFKRKLFDASFWIGIAFLFYPESLLFILLPFLGILFYANQDFKNWLIPFFALFSVFILKTCLNLLVFNQYFYPLSYFNYPTLDFSVYRKLPILIPLSFLLTFTIWSLFSYFKTIQKVNRKTKYSLYLIMITWLISIFLVLLTPHKNGAELLFFILPVCVIGANYFEQKGEKYFKEFLLVFLLLLTIIIALIPS
ncbi:DUF6427 family protein [Mesonia aestuariivivens]|uniref:Beta-carotene 15,15'-monooxygenase n=1 Tax=Mesonia aestuariivivens TaxID=2796128 RepID=A0ABS6W2Z8_9FLAO|nr:DUF6427 family protein [Mesonia aestuariivivens]MBW2961513.1 hypothetical protein [Mesonia aestuariivivens]